MEEGGNSTHPNYTKYPTQQNVDEISAIAESQNALLRLYCKNYGKNKKKRYLFHSYLTQLIHFIIHSIENGGWKFTWKSCVNSLLHSFIPMYL